MPHVKEFNFSTQTWTDLPDLPYPVNCHGSACLGNRLYALGGHLVEKGETKRWLSSVSVLDLSSPSKWEDGEPLQLAVSGPGIAVIDEETI